MLNVLKHYCPDCLLGAVGPVSQRYLLEIAANAGLDEDQYWLLLTAAEMGADYRNELFESSESISS